MSLVGGRDAVLLQAGAILVLADGATLDPGAVRSALEQRWRPSPAAAARLVRPPFGLGRAVWVDHAAFDLDQHFRVHPTREPLSRQGLLNLAVAAGRAPAPVGSAALERHLRAATSGPAAPRWSSSSTTCWPTGWPG